MMIDIYSIKCAIFHKLAKSMKYATSHIPESLCDTFSIQNNIKDDFRYS